MPKGGSSRHRKKKVRRCEECGEVMIRTSDSSYRCQNCHPNPGERIAKTIESLIKHVRPDGPGRGDVAG